jgi:hypothetical protein
MARMLAVLAGAAVLAAAPARAERFQGLKYVDGYRGARSAHGSLVLEAGELRFEDRKGRVVLAFSAAAVQASLASERRTTAGSLLKSFGLTLVAAPLTAGMVDSLELARTSHPVLLLHVGSATLRVRGPRELLKRVAAAVNDAARPASPPEASSMTSPSSVTSPGEAAAPPRPAAVESPRVDCGARPCASGTR